MSHNETSQDTDPEPKKQKPLCLGTETEMITELVREIQLREDDVILAAYPKAGTNWLWETISMLRKTPGEYVEEKKVQYRMEVVDNQVLAKLPSPRTLNTHLSACNFPDANMKAKRVKLVHVYRNPKDTCVSMFHFAKNTLKKWPVNSFEEFYENYFFGKPHAPGLFYDYLRHMHEFQQQNPEVPSFNISFEEVKKDPVTSVERLARFLEIDARHDRCVQIAEECGFNKMKDRKGEKKNPVIYENPSSEQAKSIERRKYEFFRKGQIGDWKNWFTVAMNERVDELIKEKTGGLPFKFIYE